MSLSLNTPYRDGQFNFFSYLIEIDRYSEKSAAQIEESLSKGINKFSNKFDLDATCLFMHEATHFLDMTNTLWGLEFTRRKHLFLESYKNGNTSDVFNINASEVMIHSELSIIYEETNLLECTLRHSFEYDPRHGAYVKIHFMDSSKFFCSIPLSMLSLLEANALATEILVEYRYIETQYLGYQQHDAKQKLEKKIIAILNKCNQSEYSLFLILIKVHFNFLDIKNLALFTQHFVRFVLNLSTINLAMLMGPVFHTLKNKIFGASVCEDFGRGASRHVAAFFLVFIIYNHIQSNTISEETIIELLETEDPDPIGSIIKKIIEDPEYFSSEFNDIEFEQFYKTVLENKSAFDYQLVSESLLHNLELIKSKPIGLHQPSDFMLPDFMLSDGTPITSPKRIDLDLWEYFDKNTKSLNDFDRVFKNNDIYKPHPKLMEGPISKLLLNPSQASQIIKDNDYSVLKKKGIL